MASRWISLSLRAASDRSTDALETWMRQEHRKLSCGTRSRRR
jgi:hypothetical protein